MVYAPVRVKYDAYGYDPEKDALLRRERDISFERIISLIEENKVVVAYRHPNKEKYPDQFIYEVGIDGYIYLVPFVVDGNKAFLKTIYPSHKATKRHRQRSEA